MMNRLIRRKNKKQYSERELRIVALLGGTRTIDLEHETTKRELSEYMLRSCDPSMYDLGFESSLVGKLGHLENLRRYFVEWTNTQ